MANTVLAQMLGAAAKAAGGDWAKIQPDVTAFAQNLSTSFYPSSSGLCREKNRS